MAFEISLHYQQPDATFKALLTPQLGISKMLKKSYNLFAKND